MLIIGTHLIKLWNEILELYKNGNKKLEENINKDGDEFIDWELIFNLSFLEDIGPTNIITDSLNLPATNTDNVDPTSRYVYPNNPANVDPT